MSPNHVPNGYEADFHAPEKFHVACPDCGQGTMYRTRPGQGARHCRHCDRLMGVTPVAALPDDETTTATEYGGVFVCNVCGDGFETPQALGGHKSIHAMSDGGQDGGA